ncbi:4-hydroxythreonine-4-phosphate dehydrogenase [Nitratifractor salsuginis]|uniref:4-hydroxythreonine-4-phosphate dehydrogenase n=1 Tax=Nitratifractor salsuginis (strain DSM 16511 / JCM 12458 / E9I37-1) TaxID=749222 RepID=E6WY24_NITSE|nr:4-hydroxythreonine-4-phosphate dehydrogenase [Nitratifractor salsuginis]ADV46398.1 4-hydroxythreonine-4-phosphate dehydrogenase [Nitratifractor salsuginis DSM 16511]
MKKVAISIGDLNGIGIELALRCHSQVRKLAEPLYLIDREMLEQAAELLGLEIPEDFVLESPGAEPFTIRPGVVDAAAGSYSFASFKAAVELCTEGHADAVCTLPIHKKAWELAGIPYKGHTDALRDFFGREAIMMLGCPQMYVGLYTEHIPLKEVPEAMNEERLTRFLLDFQRETGAEEIAVLGLNPHAGDHGVLGDEERIIEAAIDNANRIIQNPKSKIQNRPFEGPLVPDTAFTPAMRRRFHYFVAMYHDQGLIPLKALHFDESINVSLNLPILRTSVDHGTAFDIAYKRAELNTKSYLNAVRYIIDRTS